MSKNLRSTILSEVEHQEAAKRKEAERKINEEKQRTKEYILQCFEDELKKLLCQLKEFHSFDLSVSNMHYGVDMAKELGFVDDEYYARMGKEFLRVPNFVKGNGDKRTIVQRKLYKFETELKKARKERKSVLRDECKEVVARIRRGEYTYQLLDDQIRIRVAADISVDYEMDEIFMREYFSKRFNMHYDSFSRVNPAWIFVIKRMLDES